MHVLDTVYPKEITNRLLTLNTLQIDCTTEAYKIRSVISYQEMPHGLSLIPGKASFQYLVRPQTMPGKVSVGKA